MIRVAPREHVIKIVTQVKCFLCTQVINTTIGPETSRRIRNLEEIVRNLEEIVRNLKEITRDFR